MSEPIVIELGRGLVGVSDGFQIIGEKKLPALHFYKGGNGIVGEKLPGERYMNEGEGIVTITFGNVESLKVVMQELRQIKKTYFP